MNTEKNYEPGKIKEIYDKYAKFLKEEREKLDWTEKQEIKKVAEKEINQIEKLAPGVSSSNHIQITQDDDKTQKTITYLLEIVEKRGIMVAVETVKRMHNPFILDKFHDQLIERGVMDKVKNA